MIWIIIAIYVLIVVLELPALLKNQRRLELYTFIVFYLVGVYMSLAFYYNWPLIEPFEALIFFIGSD